FGVWYTIKACLPHIIEAKGHILITSSIYAFYNGMVNAPYAASKAAVEMLGRTLRAELAGTGATAGVLIPGWVATPIAEVAFGGNAIVTDLIKHGFPGPLRKQVKPEVIATAVVAGVESRRARIISPKRWAPISMFRGIFNMATDRIIDRDKYIHKMIRLLENNNQQ
ncbi:MAG TPA: SDR family NAD(P)-dependent oxidoreductase, partial [Spirochaetota bacterium]|nr:SDR family NAD(P)-dependent oxidoreductase [Spirochaetota bacterium]